MKFSKKLLLIVIVLTLFASCGIGLICYCANQGATSEHVWGEWEMSTTYVPTCTVKGKEIRTCSECGSTEMRDAPALGHDYASETCTTGKVCRRCGDVSGTSLGHTFGNWTSNGDGTHTRACVTDPTHTETADCTGGTATCVQRPVCDVCNAEYDGAYEHEYTDVISNGDGTHTKYCALDGTHESVTEDCQVADGLDCEDELVCGDCNHVMGTAPGHQWNGEVDCENGAECTECGATQEALGHEWQLVDSTSATCTLPAMAYYECANGCGGEHEEETAPATGHDIAGVTHTEQLKDGYTSCYYVEVYVCKTVGCGESVEGNSVEYHNYTGAITTPATCVSTGIKTLTCTDCNGQKTETIDVDLITGHAWDEGVLDTTTNIRTYTCATTGCGATKTAFDASSASNATLSSSQLTESAEIQLKDATMSLDDTTKSILGSEVELSASVLTGTDRETALSALGDKAHQVPANAKIFEFNLYNEGSEVNNFVDADGNDGFITITIPYVLEDGEDVDNIAVWFLNGSVPQSIPATYNNGYVTFSTNHFSVYTVTKLTAEERCTVYGHEYEEHTVEGTCNLDGYVLKVCARCADRVKTVTKPADGHDLYEIERVDATCGVDGYVRIGCEDCDYERVNKLAALKHDYQLVDSLASTCTQNGYNKFGCVHCDSERTVVLARLSHVKYVETVPATCEQDGYEYTRCSNEGCDYLYTLVLLALGHDYDVAFEWATDNSTATLVVTCANDEAHNVTISADVEYEELTPSCTATGLKKWTATATFDGEQYEEIKTEELGQANHVPVGEYDDDHHWTECDVCGAPTSEKVAHEFGEPTVNPATCGEDGSKVSECECGAVKTEVIPATGEHEFGADRTCVVCGADQGPCDHEILDEVKTMDFADYGICGGEMIYKSCHCGHSVVVISGFESLVCGGAQTLVVIGTPNVSVDGDGNQIADMIQQCTECGFTIDSHVVVSFDGCDMTQKMWFSASIGDVVIAEDIYYEITNTNHGGPHGEVMINFADYGMCDGGALAYECADCDKITGLIRMMMGCAIDQNKTVEKVVDGVTYFVLDDTCSVCGAVYHQEMWVEAESECEAYNMGSLKITMGGDVVFEFEDICIYSENNHDWEIVEVVKKGTKCQDGLTVKRKCTVCGEPDEQTHYEHYTEQKIIELGEHNACGGQIKYEECLGCYAVVGDNQIDAECAEFVEIDETEIVDGVEHQINGKECEICGLQILQDRWREETECLSIDKVAFSIKVGNAPLLDSLAEYVVDEHHDFTRSYVKKGEVCEDGISVVETCTRCDFKKTWETVGCVYESTTKTIEGTCSLNGDDTRCATFEMQQCALCDKISHIQIMEIFCDNFVPVGGETVNPDGSSRSEYERVCRNCGLKIVERTEKGVLDGCERDVVYVMTIYKDDVLKYEWYNEGIDYDHDFEYTYSEVDDCTNGVEVSGVCRKCSAPTRFTSYGHELLVEKTVVSAEETGACEGTVIKIKSCVCGKETSLEDNIGCTINWTHEEKTTVPGQVVDKEEPEWRISYGTCTECGTYVKVHQYVEKDENCVKRAYKSYLFQKNGETVYEQTFETGWSKVAHVVKKEFVVGDSCEDGYEVLDVCADCGASETVATGNTHDTWLIAEYDMTNYRACGGNIKFERCACGQVGFVGIGGCWQEVSSEIQEETDVSTVYYKMYQCNACGIRIHFHEIHEFVAEECRTNIEYRFMIESTFTEIVFDGLYEARHTFESGYELAPDSDDCTEGVLVTNTCKHCGETGESETIYEHVMQTIETYDLTACSNKTEGVIYYKECLCGNVWEFDRSEVGCNHNDSMDVESWLEQGSYVTSCTDLAGNTHYPIWFFRETRCYNSGCDLVTREARYWVYDSTNCSAYEVFLYEIGYDEATGQSMYVKEVITGEVMDAHQVTSDFVDGRVDDTGDVVTTTRCSVCNSHTEKTETYENNVKVKESWYEYVWCTRVNRREYKYEVSYTEVDGEYKIANERTTASYRDGGYEDESIDYTYLSYGTLEEDDRVEELYVVIIAYKNGDSIRKTIEQEQIVKQVGSDVVRYTTYLKEMVTINGEESWTKFKAEFTFGDGECVENWTWENHLGETDSGTRHPKEAMTKYASKGATCTQNGYDNAPACAVSGCGYVEAEKGYCVYPKHYRQQYSGKTYRCTTCGARGTYDELGASPTMENLSNKSDYNEGETVYAIGCQNVEDGTVSYKVSVISGSTEVDLDVAINVMSTPYNGISVLKADVQEAVTAKGIGDTFNIKFTMLIEGEDWTSSRSLTIQSNGIVMIG